MTEQEVQSRLTARMTEKFAQVHDLAVEMKRPMRDTALFLALRTVCEALEARGHLP